MYMFVVKTTASKQAKSTFAASVARTKTGFGHLRFSTRGPVRQLPPSMGVAVGKL